MIRPLCGVSLLLTDAVISTSAFQAGLLSVEAAAFAAGVSMAGLALTARSIADRALPPV
ncbi:MAG: hypothetical protein AAF907_11815 [Planctomycetota bacterium]